jgi:UDP-N-acetylmuramoyl-tripeptide--D-alanyl-D-alanine ligase
MLQATEYNVKDFFVWFYRTSDFLNVENRKSLEDTVKARILFAVGLFILIVTYIFSFSLLFSNLGVIKYILFLCLILVVPYVVLCGMVIFIYILNFCVQKPFELYLMRQAKKKLENHSGVKIAIVGSYGKTTMREIVKTVLSEGKSGMIKVSTPPKNHNTPIGISRFVEGLAGDEDILVFELGEYYPGDINDLCRLIQPKIGVITGINEAHLDRFKSLDRTTKAIFEIADWVDSNNLYVNGENDLAKNNAHSNNIIYNRDGVASLKTNNLKSDLTGTSFSVSVHGEEFKMHSNLLGLHNVGPLLASIDIALKLGLSIEEIQRGVSKTKAFEHRLNAKTDEQGVTTIDDSYNGNPDGVKAVIEFLSTLKGAHRWYVTPGLVETGIRTEEVHKHIGEILAKSGIEKVVLIKNSVTPFILSGLENSGYSGEVIWFDDALSAFKALSHLTVKGDIVLLQNDWPDQYA